MGRKCSSILGRNTAAFYKHGDVLTPNWREARGLLGRPEDEPHEAGIEETGRSLSTMLDTNVLLTLGPNGMVFFGRDGGERISMPTVAKEVFDVSGAGDTVVAAFALARAARRQLRRGHGSGQQRRRRRGGEVRNGHGHS